LSQRFFDPEEKCGKYVSSIKYELGIRQCWDWELRIYSISGQLIQSLAQNEILGTRGFSLGRGWTLSGKL